MSEGNVEFVREAARNIPVYKKVDVVVASSGSAGLGISPRKVDIPALRKTLGSQGVNLRKDVIDLSEVRKMIERRGAKIVRVL